MNCVPSMSVDSVVDANTLSNASNVFVRRSSRSMDRQKKVEIHDY